ncbi:MAG: CBS domain-containing protein [Candidatus Aenigmatarchaeota archaeon]
MTFLITGEYLKKLRLENGLSQTELAKLVDVSQAHIAKIENGKVDPRLSTINKILFVLTKRKIEKKHTKKCKDIMSKVVYIKPETPVKKIVELMKNFGFSQVPVIENGRQIGSITEETLLYNIGKNIYKLKAKDICDKPFPVVDVNESVEIAFPILNTSPAVLVSEKGKICGIITKSDLLAIK